MVISSYENILMLLMIKNLNILINKSKTKSSNFSSVLVGANNQVYHLLLQFILFSFIYLQLRQFNLISPKSNLQNYITPRYKFTSYYIQIEIENTSQLHYIIAQHYITVSFRQLTKTLNQFFYFSSAKGNLQTCICSRALRSNHFNNFQHKV